jgi:oligopeptide transport system substrate-binding protein
MFKRFACLAVVLISIGACTKKSSTGSAADAGLDPKDTFRFNLKSEPPTIDWNKSVDTTSSMVEFNIMECLVTYDLNDPKLKLIPGLATEWKASADAKTWTFVIRKGVKWTDGGDFTAQQVADGFERLLAPATASEYAYFLFPIKNARAFNAGKITDFKEVGVKVNAEGNLVVELEQAMGYFPMLLTHHSTMPIRKDVIEKHGNKWTEPGNIVTLGAYKLRAWEHDKVLVLERNDNYFGEKAKTKYVVGYMVNEFSTALNMVEAGKLDFQDELPSKELPIYRKKPGFREGPVLSIYYYGFNTRKPPFNDVRVRKAFVHALDRKQITDLMAAGDTPLAGWIPPGMIGHDPERGLKHDPKLAAKLLDEAGFKDRKKFPKITLAFNTNENHQRIAENAQAQWKKALGVEVQIANEEWKVYLNRLNTDTPDIYRLGWLGDYPDPATFADVLASYSENNHTGWKNSKYDDLVSEGSRELDPDKRKVAYSKMLKILTEDEVPATSVYSGVMHVMLSERVAKFPLNAMARWEFKEVTLK